MKAEKEAVSKGKKPFFLKKRVVKEAELKDRFESLDASTSTWKRSVSAMRVAMRATCPSCEAMSSLSFMYAVFV